MAKKTQKTEEQLANIEENLSKAGVYVEENKKRLTIIVGIIVSIICIYILYSKFYLQPLSSEASESMYIAEFHFFNNNFEKALNGDSTTSINDIGDTITQFHKGFLEISEEYSSTASGNLSSYYAGICQMNLSQYEEAIISLNDFSTKNHIIHCLSNGLIGDANRELGNLDKAMQYYVKASEDYTNNFTTPYFLMKRAQIHEQNQNYELAKDIYITIKKDYPNSKEGLEIDKYIYSISK